MERYEIVIVDRRKKNKTNVSGEDEKENDTNVVDEDPEDEKDDKKKEKKVSAKVIAKTAIAEARSLIVPHLGELTKDSLLQQKVEESLSLVDTMTSFAIHPAYGAFNLSTKLFTQAINLGVKNQQEQIRLSEAMRRASYINRSRD